MGIKVITTVVKAASSYDLTTLSVVKDELSITDNSKDASLKRYITSGSAAAAQYCNRRFQVETVKDEFWPDRDFYSYPLPGGVNVIQLSRWPVVSAVIVIENGITLVDGIDYRVDAGNGNLVRLDADLYPRPWCAWPISAQYDGGFAEIPDDVADAVIRMVTRRYSVKGRDPNLKQLSVPGVIEQSWWIGTGGDAGNLSPDIADVLENYRVPVIAV